MTKRAMHRCAVALGLLLGVPALARAQDVKDLRPATRTTASTPTARTTPAPTPASAERAPAGPTRAVDAGATKAVASMMEAKRATQSPGRERRWKRRIER